jgi:hypothetical protein
MRMAATKKSPAAAAADTAKRPVTRRRRKVTHEMIETRAYMISLTDQAGSPVDNWLAAERELLAA